MGLIRRLGRRAGVGGCFGSMAFATTVVAGGPNLYRVEVFSPVEGVESAFPSAFGANFIVGYAAPEPFHPQSVPVVGFLGETMPIAAPFDSFNQAIGINSERFIVGMSGFTPALWDDSLIYEPLAPLPGFFNGAAWDINVSRVICGNFVNDLVGHDVPCYWPSPDSEAQQLPGIGGSSVGAAFAINEDGQIAGVSAGTAVRWDDPEAAPLIIDGLPRAIISEARDINERGDIVGRSGFEDFSSRAMLFNTETGERIDLGVLGGSFSEARGINDQFQVVGSSSTDAGFAHAFLWQDGTMHDLNDLVVETNEPFAYLVNAVDITADGIIAAEVVLLDEPDSPRRIAMLIPCVVPGDLDCDGEVGFADLLTLLSAWGPCPSPPASCAADLDDDGSVGFGDLLVLLTNWG